MLPPRFTAARIGRKLLRFASDLRRNEGQHLSRRRFLGPWRAAWKPQIREMDGEPESIGGAAPLADQRHIRRRESIMPNDRRRVGRRIEQCGARL